MPRVMPGVVQLYEALQWWRAEEDFGHLTIVPFNTRLAERPVLLGDTDSRLQALDRIPTSEWEMWAGELAEQVRTCGGGEKGLRCGEGVEHTHRDVEDAFRTAIGQLEKAQHGQEWLNIQKRKWLMATYGEIVPTITLLPTDIAKQEYKALIPDNYGALHFYEPGNGVLKDMLWPRSDQLLVPESDGLGYRLSKVKE